MLLCPFGMSGVPDGGVICYFELQSFCCRATAFPSSGGGQGCRKVTIPC